MLRPLRLLRLLALARILNRSATSSLVGRVSTYVLGTSMMAAALGALAVLDVEQDADGANITTIGDALWWAATTVTTVGYGDRFPVTGQGRVIAVALMVVGIATVGAVTASIAAWMVAQVQQHNEASEVPTPRRSARRRTSRWLVLPHAYGLEGVSRCSPGARVHVTCADQPPASSWFHMRSTPVSASTRFEMRVATV